MDCPVLLLLPGHLAEGRNPAGAVPDVCGGRAGGRSPTPPFLAPLVSGLSCDLSILGGSVNLVDVQPIIGLLALELQKLLLSRSGRRLCMPIESHEAIVRPSKLTSFLHEGFVGIHANLTDSTGMGCFALSELSVQVHRGENLFLCRTTIIYNLSSLPTWTDRVSSIQFKTVLDATHSLDPTPSADCVSQKGAWLLLWESVARYQIISWIMTASKPHHGTAKGEHA